MIVMEVQTDDLIGAPFVWGGTGDPGYDCYTLAQEIAKRKGYNLPDLTTYIDRVARAAKMEEARQDFIKLDQPKPFSIIAFKRLGILFHIGTVLPGCTKFIHIRKTPGVIISRINDISWKFLREGFYQHVDCIS